MAPNATLREQWNSVERHPKLPEGEGIECGVGDASGKFIIADARPEKGGKDTDAWIACDQSDVLTVGKHDPRR